MSPVTAIHEQHAATERKAAAARDEVVGRRLEHRAATAEKREQVAAIEAAYLADATARALGEKPADDLPDANELERLRADVAVASEVDRQLTIRVEAAERDLSAAKSEHRAAVASCLRENAVEPALADLHFAFDMVRAAAVNLMAAHHLAYRKFADRAPDANSSHELYGPVAEWLHDASRMDWPTYPYKIRPAWIPEHGYFFAFDLPGVAERVQELLAIVEQVPA